MLGKVRLGFAAIRKYVPKSVNRKLRTLLMSPHRFEIPLRSNEIEMISYWRKFPIPTTFSKRLRITTVIEPKPLSPKIAKFELCSLVKNVYIAGNIFGEL